MTTQHAELFKVLAHPVRIAILHALRTREECVCHLEAQLGLRQAYLSQQLAVLRKHGLIRERRDGLNKFYRIVRPEVMAVLDAVALMIGPAALPTPSAQCPCPRCNDPIPITLQ